LLYPEHRLNNWAKLPGHASRLVPRAELLRQYWGDFLRATEEANAPADANDNDEGVVDGQPYFNERHAGDDDGNDEEDEYF
ncbi:hypothetical protein HDU96_000458, partial [Phlyctochytrium bullatum]